MSPDPTDEQGPDPADEQGLDPTDSPPTETDPTDATEPPAGDRGVTSPEAVLAAGLSPLLSLAQQASGAVGLPEPAVLADDVSSLPPEERFRSSASRYADRFDVPLLDPAGLAAAGEDLPVDDPLGTAVETVVRNAGRWQGQLLAQLVEGPDDPDPYLALAVLLARLERTAIAAKEGHETGEYDLDHLFSTGLAVLAGLVTLVEDESAVVDDGTVRDAVLASYHVEVATGGDPSFDPAERSDADCRRIVRLQGALLAFDTFDRSVAEVGELTGVGAEPLLAALERRDGD